MRLEALGSRLSCETARSQRSLLTLLAGKTYSCAFLNLLVPSAAQQLTGTLDKRLAPDETSPKTPLWPYRDVARDVATIMCMTHA